MCRGDNNINTISASVAATIRTDAKKKKKKTIRKHELMLRFPTTI
jgi:hypothetical protein